MLFVCSRCGFTFVSPLPQDTGAVYGEDYFAGATEGYGYVDYDADKEPMTPIFERYLHRIARFGPQKGKILDIGAATGFFLAIAKRFGYDPYGVELSSYAAARARQKGIPMVTGTLADVADSLRYDAITMLDVLEHVKDPRAELKRAHALLAEGGLLAINTPDIGSLYARIMGKRWHLIVPPEHLQYFNRRNLARLLEASGFQILEITTIGKSFTLQYIFKTLYGWQGFAIWNRLSELAAHGWLRRISLPINLRDNMFVIAQKK